MELWLTLVALYAWQCMTWLHVPAAVFGPRWLGASELQRRGVHALSPWPSTLGVVAARIPFVLVDDGRAFVLRGGDALASSRTIAFESLTLERRGARVVANGRTTLEASSKAQARHWHEALAQLAATLAADRPAAWHQLASASLDHQALAGRLNEARHATRWLARVCDADLLIMALAVPGAGVVSGAEYALAVSLPVVGGLHLLTLVLAYLAHRRLFSERRGERFEEIFMSALYPPALLRRAQVFVDAATVGFHPLAWVRVLEDEPTARSVWLREAERLAREAERRPSEAAELLAERDLVIGCAPDEWTLRTERPRSDPTAMSYCPLCGDDFRAGFDRCEGCAADTIPYSASPG